ncbi:hypothetical protein JCM10908_003558 [Rhodotorula pacifica]|uniref:uncharacterized protein n=1 Tax=Rhodotorula pacifica TaxID=1495444 RepID=UPI003172B8E9
MPSEGAEQESLARQRLLQAHATAHQLRQRLFDAKLELATRHSTRLLANEPPSQQDSANKADYAQKLLDRANELRARIEKERSNRVVARAVVKAIDQQVLVTNHLAATSPAAAAAGSEILSPRQAEIATLLKRKDELSFRLLALRKELHATTLERSKLRRPLNRDNAATVAFLQKRRDPPLLSSSAAEELVSSLSPSLQAYHASLSDALVLTSAKLVRLNHIFQKLVAELALPLHTYLPSTTAMTSAVVSNGDERDVQMRDAQAEQGEDEEGDGWLTPQKLLELVLLAGRSVEEEYDLSDTDLDSDSDNDKDSDPNTEPHTSDPRDEERDAQTKLEWPEEVREEMVEWERNRKEEDPWLVARRRDAVRVPLVEVNGGELAGDV